MATGFQMDGMLPTVWLIIGAVTSGTLLEEFGMITRLVEPLIRAARTTGRLFATVFACAFGLNLVAGDQYIALIPAHQSVQGRVRPPRPGTHQPVPAGR